MTEKWELDTVNCDEVEKNSDLTFDGGFDFNSGWNWIFRVQGKMSSIAAEESVPPKGFKMFFKENTTSDANGVCKGNLRITIEGNGMGEKYFYVIM